MQRDPHTAVARTLMCKDDGAARDRHNEVGPVGAALTLTTARPAGRRILNVVHVPETPHPRIRLDDHVSALAAVAAVRRDVPACTQSSGRLALQSMLVWMQCTPAM